MGMMAHMFDSKAFFNTPRRGFIQDGQYTPYPKDFGGPWRGETDEEFRARLAEWDQSAEAK